VGLRRNILDRLQRLNPARQAKAEDMFAGRRRDFEAWDQHGGQTTSIPICALLLEIQVALG